MLLTTKTLAWKGKKMTQTATKKTAEQIKTKTKIIINTDIESVVSRFLDLTSTTFIQLWQVTEPKMNKTGNLFYGEVTKTNCLNCVTNYNYQNMVNNARSKEAMQTLRIAMENAGVPTDKIDLFFTGAKSDIAENAERFESDGLPWGAYVDDSKCIIEHTPKSGVFAYSKGFYIQVAVMHSADPVYRWKESGDLMTDDKIAEMKTFFPVKKDGGKQGLAKPYIIRSPRWETIENVSLKGVNYNIKY